MRPSGPSPTTCNWPAADARTLELLKANCDTALWLMLPCGLHTCSFALRFEEKPARTMPFCLFPRKHGEPDRGRGAKTDDALPSLLAIL